MASTLTWKGNSRGTAGPNGTMNERSEELERIVARRRSRRENLLRYRYKEGFDRIGIVLFGLFALAFVLLWAFVHEPYALPGEGTPEAAAIAAELEDACRDDLEQALVMLCHERILGGHRWAFYSERLDVESNGWLYATFLLAMAAGAAWPVWRWVRRGFDKGRESRAGG